MKSRKRPHNLTDHIANLIILTVEKHVDDYKLNLTNLQTTDVTYLLATRLLIQANNQNLTPSDFNTDDGSHAIISIADVVISGLSKIKVTGFQFNVSNEWLHVLHSIQRTLDRKRSNKNV